MATSNAPIDPVIPAHVPPELVATMDLERGETMNRCPHADLAKLQDGPRVFYNPTGRNPDGGLGFWVPTRVEDLRQVLQQTETFSSRQIARFSMLMGESWDLIPAEKDPPEHGKYRKLLNPMFGPGAVASVAPRIRQHAIRLIDPLVSRGECEFVADFSKPFPILIFMAIMGLPLDRFAEVVDWGHDLHEGATMAERSRGAIGIGGLLREEIAVVRDAPRDDVLSKLVHAQIEGEPATEDEIIGMAYLLFAGGIHTVTASLGFAAQHLARDQALQDRLRATPGDIPAAIEEMLRAYSVVNSFRRVTADLELSGAPIKAGDWVLNGLPIVNHDRSAFADPETVDIDRSPNRHMGFSFGIHFCLGVHLARAEMAIAWQEWLARIPPFRVREEQTKIAAGMLLGVDHLELEWG